MSSEKTNNEARIGLSSLNAELGSVHWNETKQCDDEDTLYSANLTDGSRITVLNRMTGFGFRDIESGYRNKDGKFWLASGNCDVRCNEGFSVEQAIEWIKANANTCVAA